jgi:putative oxidoreductase
MKMNKHVGMLMVRFAIGVPMLIYGINKMINGIAFIAQMLEENGLPSVMAYGVYAGEVLAPILILVGFRTRLAAIIFAVNCLTAILLTQTSSLFSLNQYGGWAVELLVIYMLVGLSLMFTGAGKYAVSTNNQWD